MKLSTKIRNAAEITHTVSKAEEVGFIGICARIANAHLRHNGWYSCLFNGKKTLLISAN